MPAAKKKTTTKKSTRRAPAKSTSSTKVVRKSAPAMRSFRRYTPEQPFMTFKLTEQTLYWLILSAIVLTFGLWIFSMDAQIQQLYDRVDAAQATLSH